MKFCYLDESGTGDEPFSVMAGIIVDVQRMHIIKQNWKELLAELSVITGKEIKEIHTKDFYPGNGPWRGLSAEKRSEIISKIFGWIKERKHNTIYTAVDKEKLQQQKSTDQRLSELSLWQIMALHISLALQKRFQAEEKNKGHTFLIFDRKNIEEKRFGALLNSPPEWTDTYYGKTKGSDRLNNIIDVPYFGDSEEVALIQMADFVCFFLRKYVELSSGKAKPKYDGEEEKIKEWLSIVFERAIPKANIYPVKSRCDCAEVFFKMAPDVLIQSK